MYFLVALLFCTCHVSGGVAQDPESKLNALDASLFRQQDGCRAGVIVAGSIDGYVVAFDAWSGKIKWTLDSGGPLVSSTSLEAKSASCQSNERPKNSNQVAVEEDSHPLDDGNTCSAQQHQYIPSLDGRIYSLSHEGQLEASKYSLRDLVSANVPQRSDLDHMVDSFLVGEKKTKLYSVEMGSGKIERVDEPSPPGAESESESAAAKETRVFIGRSEYTSRAVRVDNGSLSWSMTVGEYFVHSATQQCPDTRSFIDQHNDRYPSFECTTGRTIVARHPSTREVLWTWDFHSLVVSMFGLTATGSVFQEFMLSGPSRDVVSPEYVSNSLATSPLVLSVGLMSPNMALEVHTATLPASETNVIIQNVGHQLYILPGVTTSHAESPKRPTEIPQQQQQQYLPMNSGAGLFITWNLAGWIALSVALFCIVIALVCYRRGKRRSSNSAFGITRKIRDAYLSWKATKEVAGEAHSRSIAAATAQLVSNTDSILPRSPLLQRSISLGSITDVQQLRGQRTERQVSAQTPQMTKNKKMPYHHRSGSMVMAKTLLAGVNDSEQESPTGVESVEEDIPNGQFWNSSSSAGVDQDDSWGNLPVCSSSAAESSIASSPQGPLVPLPFVSTSRFSKEFEQSDVLGKGGFGEVFSARNLLDGRMYAVKRIGLCTTSEKDTLQKVLHILDENG